MQGFCYAGDKEREGRRPADSALLGTDGRRLRIGVVGLPRTLDDTIKLGAS